MQLHQLKPTHKLKRKKRVGRGGKRGTYSGRGIKGQKARAGRKLAPLIREILKRYPKLSGYRHRAPEKVLAVVNLETLDEKFSDSEIVNPQTLINQKIIRRIKGRIPKVKILGKGKLTKALTIQSCDVSRSAKEAIKKAGGSIK